MYPCEIKSNMRPGVVTLAAKALVLVMCPPGRERLLSLFADARALFVRAGFAASDVHRAQGFDMQQTMLPRRRRLLGPFRGGRACACDIVTLVVMHCSIPRARLLLLGQAQGEQRVAIFAEDDCRLRPGTSREEFVDHVVGAHVCMLDGLVTVSERVCPSLVLISSVSRWKL